MSHRGAGDSPARFELGPRRSPRLANALHEAWGRGLHGRVVAYDPSRSRPVSIPPYRFHFLPERTARPGAVRAAAPPAEGLRCPHEPCSFDDPDFVATRGIATLAREGRTYHLTCNRYPVTSHHFLLVRDASAPPEVLPQCVHGPEEVEDLLCFLIMAAPPYRVYFNSNRGADNSQSGSSVNHWHFQTFPLDSGSLPPLQRLRHEPLEDRDGVTVGEVAEWPARHRLLEAPRARLEALAHALWVEIQRLQALNVAYNLEAIEVEGARLRAYLFPRHPAADTEIPGAGAWSANFGGWELSGDIVVPTAEILAWIRAHPEEAVGVTEARLRSTTFVAESAH